MALEVDLSLFSNHGRVDYQTVRLPLNCPSHTCVIAPFGVHSQVYGTQEVGKHCESHGAIRLVAKLAGESFYQGS